ncbi:IclR family pca regulon transcriptional regulator [Amycolatopsis bartoniae]|uniref:Glycerol operon regulatory protein n=1 Tax=Amycolatopsis bartoniae TaxID=941986 RepID=A0A8H9MGQ3_9PSEU|nr:IclR family transcriptional regulator [Amycolatopsis bartoniae]MBB2937647.1 IclR family pca regulon transcriptional regulator [Amycolatopsis bartoniae]TVS98951.1 IclR family transcriptional regulator [Amycolatopsis bartoniae]GHF82798.1 IclR family transcriptional regulator [Amycolatopsis bartoniae]
MPVEDQSHRSQSQSLERGLAILACFGESRPVLGAIELARLAGLNKSTAHRYLTTLTNLGYLQQEPGSRKYRLGPRVVDLGFAALNSMEITKVAGPHLQALSNETGYAVSMAILDGTEVLYIQRCRSTREGRCGIDLNLHVGSRLPAYCTAMGKVLLAYRKADELRALLDRIDLARRGPNTMTAREALLIALGQVRATGLAVNDEELAAGLRSLAVPVRDGFGQVLAAVNVAVHLSIWHASMESIQRRLEHPLRHTADQISKRMGYPASDRR